MAGDSIRIQHVLGKDVVRIVKATPRAPDPGAERGEIGAMQKGLLQAGKRRI